MVWIFGDSALLRQSAPVRQASRSAIASIPKSYDWRKPDQNRPVGITAVKDQGQCGSCWSFSATEELESAWILAGNEPVVLAPQQTVDCDTVDGGSDNTHTHTYTVSHIYTAIRCAPHRHACCEQHRCRVASIDYDRCHRNILLPQWHMHVICTH